MKKWVKATSLLMVAVLAIGLSGCGKKPGEEAVATVNGEDITRAQLDKRITKLMEVYKSQGQNFDLNSPENKVMKQGIESQILEGMIKEKLLLQEADKQGVMPSETDINKQVTDIKKRFTDDKQFKDALTKFGMDEESFLDWVKQSLASKALFDKVTKGVTVTEADIKNYY
ncbi:MAG TPA: SurA N-terminal domain-containing protein, partial [Bacillota bacterium]|nr:SurA N-terminal domain-containing protein [Bacillota bacterium]